MSRRVLVHLEAHQVHFQHPDGDSIQSFCGLRDTDFQDQPEEGVWDRWVVTCAECKKLMAEREQEARKSEADYWGQVDGAEIAALDEDHE